MAPVYNDVITGPPPMPEPDSFCDLLRRVRRGDAAAADELWRQYEPLLRREIRLRLRDPHLRQRFDEDDICQSVMASFFVGVVVGRIEVKGPDQLRQLLARIGRNKLASQARRHTADRRNCRSSEPLPEDGGVACSRTSTASSIVAWQELFQRFRAQLSDEERQLADWRSQERAWTDIVAQIGGTVDGRRVQLHRAIARVSRDLGLVEPDEQCAD
jgi:DNA-directed RNA polymerase specialized sigma24 family protein